MSVTVYGKLNFFFKVNNYRMNFSVVLVNKDCVQKCSLSPKIIVGVGWCKFRYNIVNFDKKRSVPKENPLEVEVSVVKMIVITGDDCICKTNGCL